MIEKTLTDWIYKGTNIAIEDVPSESIGFIYIITQKSTGKKYIGRKMLTKAGTKSVNGKKKKIRLMSDWPDYWSSSPDLKQKIKEIGTQDFTKEILVFVSSKGNLAYCEEMALYMVGALESDQWENNNIRSKVYRSWCRPAEAMELRKLISKFMPAI